MRGAAEHFISDNRDRGGGGAGGASAPPDYLAVTSKKDCFYF